MQNQNAKTKYVSNELISISTDRHRVKVTQTVAVTEATQGQDTAQQYNEQHNQKQGRELVPYASRGSPERAPSEEALA